MIARQKAVTQLVGFLVMENGLFLGATAATYGMPLDRRIGGVLRRAHRDVDRGDLYESVTRRVRQRGYESTHRAERIARGLMVMIEVAVLLIAPLLAGGLSLVIHRSALLHAINLTSMSVLVTAEIMITRTVLRDGPFTALGQLVYLDALSTFILFIIGAVGLACSLYMRSYMDEQVARGVIAPGRLNMFFFLFHMFLLAMVIATIANSVGVQWVAIEATTLTTPVFSITYETERIDATT